LGIGISLKQAGDLSGAADAYRRSVELLETAHELSGMPEELPARAEALMLLAGVLHHSLGEPEEAVDAYEAAAGIYGELEDPWHLRKVLLGMSGLRWRVGDLEGSAHHYEKVLDSAQDYTTHQAAALAGLGVVYRGLGHLKESLRSGREALRLVRDLKDVSGREVEVASARLVETEERARRLRWLHSYNSEERGRNFRFRYEAPSMETMLEDSRRAGLSHAPEAVAEFLEPTIFS
jgi:tetratricopeptide (TPR) repeat protein